MIGNKTAIVLAATLAAVLSHEGAGAGKGMHPRAVALQNERVRYVIGENGKNLSLLDKRSNKEYCARPGQHSFMAIRKGGQRYEATACSFAGGRMRIEFQPPGAAVLVKATCHREYFVFEVESVSDPSVDEIVLSTLAVTSCKYVSEMSGTAADDEFAVCVRALNLQVNANVRGSPAVLSTNCLAKYGLVGAKLALVACPTAELRAVLKEVVRDEDLPHSPLGGPWALDAEENRGSYTFAVVTEENVDGWIALARKAGLTHLLFTNWIHVAGHYQPPKRLYPRGLEGVKTTVDKIHAAGLKAGIHTATGLIAPQDPWVTPVPDKRLATDAVFTMTTPVDQRQNVVPIAEQPEEFDTVWQHAGRGNVIRIDDELIQYTGLSRDPPYGFTGCTRGAFGTKATTHDKSARVQHMFSRYLKFLPDENSTLVEEVAQSLAGVVNHCGFDMVYMDGAEGMHGGWHGLARMQTTIFQKIGRPVMIEASCWNYHLWPFCSRIGAWDTPGWGRKRFIDLHCRPDELDIDGRTTARHFQSTMLPCQLGWWTVLGGRDRRALLPDELEYLCCKAIGYDLALSFQGFRPGNPPPNARQEEFLELVGRYERFRLARYFPSPVRDRLKQANQDFHLMQTPDGGWELVAADYATHKVTGLDDGPDRWTVNNRFQTQPLRLRLTALYGVEPYEDAQASTLVDFASDEFTAPAAAQGVTHVLGCSRDQVKVGTASGRYQAASARTSPQGAWAKVSRLLSPSQNLDRFDAMGVWIHGDGKGELLNFRLTHPRQHYPVLDEHYVTVDFHGWRYFDLLLRERDADRYGDYQWPDRNRYGNGVNYAVHREPLDRKNVHSLDLYFNNLPPRDSVTCYLSPIKALRARKTALHNPSLRIKDCRIVFPVTLESGSYIEFAPPACGNAPDAESRSAFDCRLYDERGALVRKFQHEGAIPVLAAGRNEVAFACEALEKARARVEVTVISHGQSHSSSRGISK